jgi:hypothetical protein
MIKNGQKYVITTNDWFIAPDGHIYKAAWGTCQVRSIKEVFSFEPLRPSTNWYLTVGGDGREVIIAGCQIHYAVRSEEIPNDKKLGETYIDKNTGLEASSSNIYLAEPNKEVDHAR